MLIAGDDPEAGGRASNPFAYVFSTYIQRTIYLPRKLQVPLSASDRPYLTGSYKWGTSVEQNLRGDFIRKAQERRRDFTVDWVHLKLNDQAQRTVLCKDPFRSHDERVQRLIDSM